MLHWSLYTGPDLDYSPTLKIEIDFLRAARTNLSAMGLMLKYYDENLTTLSMIERSGNHYVLTELTNPSTKSQASALKESDSPLLEKIVAWTESLVYPSLWLPLFVFRFLFIGMLTIPKQRS
jgi:hypothetical protein